MKQLRNSLLSSMFMLAGISITGLGQAQEATPETHAGNVLASFQLESGRLIKLVEYAPGITGVAEGGIPVLGTRVITPELAKLSLVEIYRHFAGTSTRIPDSILAADARAVAKAKASAGKPTSPHIRPAPYWKKPSDGEIVRPETYDEIYNWFIPTYCDQYGAKVCIYQYDGASVQTPPVSYSGAAFFVGSEGSSSASIEGLYWDPDYGTWIPAVSDSVAPGWCWYYTMTSSYGPLDMQWNMWGAGYDTTIGLADYY
ncbi:MAG: hypothetical protein ACM3ZE_07295 [Myxococcales bacterium]